MKRLITFLCLIPVFLYGQDLYYPEEGSWDERLNNGFDRGLLDDAVDFAMENEYSGSRDLRIAILEGFAAEPYHEIKGPVKKRGGPAGLIIKDGFIAAKWGDLERVDMTFSVTKSYLSTVAGLAWQDGKIKLNEPVANYIWDGKFEGPHNSSITWDHLLTQSSDWSGELFGMYDWADRPPREGTVDDWKLRDLNKPGTVFEYNAVRVNLLAYSLLQVLHEPLPSVLREKVMDPIGASSTWRWFGYDHAWVTMDGFRVQSVTGGGHSGGGIFINTYDQARFGLLFARRGRWKNEQIISGEWIDRAKTPSEALDQYGYMWWLHGEGEEPVPDRIYSARGFGGNFIIVDEANDLVIVTRWLEPNKLEEFVRLVYEALL
ncbi:MAG: serine hydrolase [Cyclobacteriaceae bacterium]